MRPADVVVLALGPWTSQAQRWLALPQVFGSRGASIVLAADVPSQVVFSEFLTREGQRSTLEIYPRPGGAVYVNGYSEHGALPDDPDEIIPSIEAGDELHRRAGVHSTALRDAEVVTRGLVLPAAHRRRRPADRPRPGRPGGVPGDRARLVGHLTAPATGRMVSEMILDGGSHSLDATPYALARLPMGRLPA